MNNIQSIKQTPSYIVAIGASAGGLEALQLLFQNIPPDTGLAFVVIQHLSPDYKSLMVELLSRQTTMTVLRVENNMTVQANCVYLIPPKKNMTIKNNELFLIDQPMRHGLNLPIDEFFRSLAMDRGDSAIGIVLSGTGSDGTMGIRLIKEQGGIVMVQDEITARFDGMPKSAIATGLADYILPPDKMPGQLLNFINHPAIIGKHKDSIAKDDDYLGRIMTFLRSKTKVDFTMYKSNTVNRRIERRMGIVQAFGIEEYALYMEKNPEEIKLLYKDLLIGVTKFFRDKDAFSILKDNFIPKIVSDAESRNDRTIRIWVAGCSTGEEAYSIAIYFYEYLRKKNISLDIKVFASDIDNDALKFAGIGLYPESIIADIDIELLSRYFEKTDKGYRISRLIRSSMLFAYQNIINDPPFTKVDMISCRNLLIYLQQALQHKVLSVFNYALLPEGYLFLGSSESVGEMENEFLPIDTKWRIYKHRGKGIIPFRYPMDMVENTKKFVTDSLYIGMNKPFKQNSRFDTQKHFYETIIKKLVPCLLILNENRELVQSFGVLKQFLNVPEGEASLDILRMLPRELSLAVSSAFHKTMKEKQEVCYKDIRINNDQLTRVISIRMNAFQDPKTRQNLFLLMLSEQESEQRTQEDQANENEFMADQRIYDLEQELLFTRENLQATIEELQTSNEELQATNEELLASNEELQSTNEELQSVNEELNTVNNEYQEKVAEMTDLNNDLNNLIKSANIGIIFLDRDFCIRRLSMDCIEGIDLRAQDVGRPLNTFSVPMMDNLPLVLKQVLNSSDVYYKDICMPSGKWYLLRIQPYKNENQIVKGLVLTFTDITEVINFQNQLIKSESIRRSLIDNSPCLICLQDIDGKIIEVNSAFIEVFEKSRIEIIGKYPEKLLTKELAIQEKQIREQIIQTMMPITTIEKYQNPYLTMRYPILNHEGIISSIGMIAVKYLSES